MGFSDREIVALSGAHTIGRAFKERSGVTENGYGAKNGTKFTGCPAGHGGGGGTCPFSARHDGDADKGVGMEGGRSWTKHWLKFDNSYFKREHDEDPANLLWMSTDKALHVDDEFRKVFEENAESQEAFFADFAAAYKKLSECGARWKPVDGIVYEW